MFVRRHQVCHQHQHDIPPFHVMILHTAQWRQQRRWWWSQTSMATSICIVRMAFVSFFTGKCVFTLNVVTSFRDHDDRSRNREWERETVTVSPWWIWRAQKLNIFIEWNCKLFAHFNRNFPSLDAGGDAVQAKEGGGAGGRRGEDVFESIWQNWSTNSQLIAVAVALSCRRQDHICYSLLLLHTRKNISWRKFVIFIVNFDHHCHCSRFIAHQKHDKRHNVLSLWYARVTCMTFAT